MTDSVRSTFIERTHVDPALARDLLDATDWNLEAAVTAYHSLYDTKTVEPEEYQYDPSEFIDAIACTIPNQTIKFIITIQKQKHLHDSKLFSPPTLVILYVQIDKSMQTVLAAICPKLILSQ